MRWWSLPSWWAPLAWFLPSLGSSAPKQEGKTMSSKGGLLALLGSYSYFKVTTNTIKKKSMCWPIFGQFVKKKCSTCLLLFQKACAPWLRSPGTLQTSPGNFLTLSFPEQSKERTQIMSERPKMKTSWTVSHRSCASQVRNRRRALHRLVLVRVGPRWWSCSPLFLQSRWWRERVSFILNESTGALLLG